MDNFKLNSAVDEFVRDLEQTAVGLVTKENKKEICDSAAVIPGKIELLEIDKVSEDTAAPIVKEERGINEQDKIIISSEPLPVRLKYALFGNQHVRALLIRDNNKLVSFAVLRNPRLTLKEVDDFSRNPNLSEYVLRHIAFSDYWMKNYSIKAGIVFNPKTPVDVSIKLMRSLLAADIKKLARSHSVPAALVGMAKKLMIKE